jgi:hypothetical protein
MTSRRELYLLPAIAAALSVFLIGGEQWHHPVIPSLHAQPAKIFTVFDGTLYKNKPNLSSFGVKPIKIIYGHEFWEPGQNMEPLPTRARVREVASSAQALGVPVVIDIEHWLTSPTVHKVSAATAQESVAKYAAVLSWFREAVPDRSVGLYGIVPMIDYWRAIERPSSALHLEWVADSERALSLVGLVDVLFPSLYTFYVDQKGWVAYATAQLIEARRLAAGKPVYVFLWPQYHNSNPFVGERYLPDEYWKLELDTVRKYADGVVLWGGWADNGPAMWDDKAGWWTVTKQFLRTLEDRTPPSTVQDLKRK